MLPRIITSLVGWAVAIFYDVERTGPPLPEGPVLLTANHPNALVDPLVVFHTAGRATRPLAKAPLFEQPLVGMVLKGLGGLPVYRRQDDASLMHMNDRTFDAAIAALSAGGAVQIYPEGFSHSEPAMAPLRTGAARIALMSEERAGWGLGLKIQPVGLTYTRKHRFRGRAIAAYGAPVRVADFRVLFEQDEREAVRQLTEEIRSGLHGVTLNFERPGDQELIDVAERLYAREKGIAGVRERERMARRLPRLQRFTRAMERLRDEDPARLDALGHAVSRYQRMLTLLGVTDGDVPAGYSRASMASYVARQTAMLFLVLPAAIVGAVFWLVPFMLTPRIAARFRPKLDQVATYKVSVGMLAFPAWLALGIFVAWRAGGVRWSVALLIALPLAGLAAVAWRERQAVLVEDLRLFLRARGRTRSRERLAEMRTQLVRSFDEIAASWQDPGGEARD